jgi:hypothetical protein
MKDTVSRLVMTLLYHFKSVEHRLEWSKAIDKFHGRDKLTINNAINKVRTAINDVASMAKTPEQTRQIKATLLDDDRMVLFMTLVEQMFDQPIEDLQEITDLIDHYLQNKYEK